MHRQEFSSNSTSRGPITTAEVLDRAMNQCMHRGLFDSAAWLGQLALDANENILREYIPITSPVAIAVQDTPLTGRAHRHHVVALALMQKGEYLRCHHQLTLALQEYTMGSDNTEKTAEVGKEEEEDEEEKKNGSETNKRDYATQKSRGSRGQSTPQSSQRKPQEQQKQEFTWSPLFPPQLQFLCIYSLYMAGECIKNTNSNPRKSTNPHLRMLRGMLLTALEQQRNSSSTFLKSNMKSVPRSSPTKTSGLINGASSYGDPFLCWLHGVVLRELGMKQESATYFLAALCNHPMLWCAWEDLCTLVSRENQIEEIEAMIASLEPRFMSEIFLASVKAALNVAPVSFIPPSNNNNNTTNTNNTNNNNTNGNTTGQRSSSPHGSNSSPQPRTTQEQQQERRGDGSASPRLVNSWELLLEQFPNNLFLLSSLAGYYYNLKKDLEKAHNLYKKIHEMNPYRLESMDDYSIVLFLRGDRIGLSSLAQQVYYVDPFRAESNYVVGNYYVLMGAHDRGVLHFRRAVAADPTFLAAWTLLGHAYLETKNSAAAVEAYRTAVDLDQRDYRGWYNLGQIYELLQFYHHALYYYWHTTTLRPTDPRMWSAVANCLEREGRTGEAMLCLERAEAFESSNSVFYPPLVRRLGMYYLSARQVDRAISYLEKLANSEARKREDVLLAAPHVIPYYLQQARQLLDVPSRSPSYDPPPHFSPTGTGGNSGQTITTNININTTNTNTTTTGGGGGGGGGGMNINSGIKSSLADQWIVADAAMRRNIEARWEQASMCLVTVENHLENFAIALGFPSAATAAADNITNKSMEYNTNSNSMMDEGRNRNITHLTRHYRELSVIRHYLNGQQQQVELMMRQIERSE